MPALLGECEQAARAGGLAAGLALALTGVDVTAPPARIAAVPSTMVPAGAIVVRHFLADQEGISFVRCGGRAPAPASRLTEFGARLGAVRIGITWRLLDSAVRHLSGRVSGGEPTIRKQLVQGVLADVMTAAEAARHCLHVAGHVPAAVLDVHDRLTVLDWETAKLLGGSGYLADGAARGAYVSRLAANCWIAREGIS